MLNILMNLSKFGVLFMKLYNETFYGLLNFVEETVNFLKYFIIQWKYKIKQNFGQIGLISFAVQEYIV